MTWIIFHGSPITEILFPVTSSRTNQSRTTSLEVSKKSPFGREKIPKAVPHSTLHFGFLLSRDALGGGTGWEPAFAQGEIWPEKNGISWKSRHPGFYDSGIMTCFKELKRFWKWSGSISEVPLYPPSSALRAPSPSREKVLLRFL